MENQEQNNVEINKINEENVKTKEVKITIYIAIGIIVFMASILFAMFLLNSKKTDFFRGTWYEYKYMENGMTYRNKDWDKSRSYITFNEDHTGYWKAHLIDYNFKWKLNSNDNQICLVNLNPDKNTEYNAIFYFKGDVLCYSFDESSTNYFTRNPDYSIEDKFPDNPKPTITPEPTPAPTLETVLEYNYFDSGDYDSEYYNTNDYEEDYDETEYLNYVEYIFWDSDQRYLTDDDIEGMSKKEINRAKNELYARHGRMFNDEKLQEYFDSCGWYEPIYTPEEWEEYGDRYFFNDYEMENRNFLKEAEK